MSATDRLFRAGGTILRSRPRWADKRLPLWIAVPLIAGLSALLWLGLFHLLALLF
jgi:hypothetical protein